MLKSEKSFIEEFNKRNYQPQLLFENDEIIVSDDCPTDAVREIIKSLDDNRINYVAGPGKGVIKNFENAISLSTGDCIFLCDQDDVWCEGKVSACVGELQNGATLVMNDAKIVDSNLFLKEESFFKMHNTKTGIFNNILKKHIKFTAETSSMML